VGVPLGDGTMKFGPQNAAMLSTLLAALQGGLDPGVGASQLSSIVAQQQAQRDVRRQEMASLTDQLLGLAQQGQPLGASQAYLSSLGEAGLVRPQMQDRAEGVLNTAYGLEANPTFTAPGRGEIEGTLPLSRISPQTLSPLAPPAAPMEPNVFDDDDKAALWTDIVTILKGGSSPYDQRAPESVLSQLSVKYGPLLAGHEQELIAMIQQALATLGEQAPANIRMAERGY
jgi:hypothetical protein